MQNISAAQKLLGMSAERGIKANGAIESAVEARASL